MAVAAQRKKETMRQRIMLQLMRESSGAVIHGAFAGAAVSSDHLGETNAPASMLRKPAAASKSINRILVPVGSCTFWMTRAR